MLKKQRNTIIIITLLFALMAAGYFFVVEPLVSRIDPGPETEPPETTPGEEVGINNRIQMYTQVERKDMKSIEVHNEHGTYTFYRDAEGNFQILGHEGTLFDAELFASLVTTTGYTLSMTKVDDPLPPEEYGLTDRIREDGSVYTPAWFKLTTLSGLEHLVYIGDKIVTGAAYYVQYAGRPDIYILEQSLSNTILAPVEALVTPLLGYPMAMNNYFTVKNFMLFRGEETEPYVAVTYRGEDGGDLSGDASGDAGSAVPGNSSSAQKMLHPTGYVPSIVNYDTVLYTLMEFLGTETLALGLSDEVLEKYNLAKPAYTLYYEFDGIEHIILISERNPDGTYNAASIGFNIVVRMDGLAMDFVNWDLLQWIDTPIFQLNINDVEQISVNSKSFNENFMLDGQGQELIVTGKESGHKPEVNNFRQFYKTLLTTSIGGYAELTEEEMAAYRADESKCLLTLTVKTRAGEEIQYKFYPYSGRHTYVTINGIGQFYAINYLPEKIIEDARRVTQDIPVDSTVKYYN